MTIEINDAPHKGLRVALSGRLDLSGKRKCAPPPPAPKQLQLQAIKPRQLVIRHHAPRQAKRQAARRAVRPSASSSRSPPEPGEPARPRSANLRLIGGTEHRPDAGPAHRKILAMIISVSVEIGPFLLNEESFAKLCFVARDLADRRRA
jgi:hypothetical protein